jgi:hypothetical protein
MNTTETYRSGMIQDKSIRVYQTLKDVKMDILGEIRVIPEVRVSYVMDGNGAVSRCISFEEYNRIADDIHRMLRAKRRVYHEHD